MNMLDKLWKRQCIFNWKNHFNCYSVLMDRMVWRLFTVLQGAARTVSSVDFLREALSSPQNPRMVWRLCTWLYKETVQTVFSCFLITKLQSKLSQWLVCTVIVQYFFFWIYCHWGLITLWCWRLSSMFLKSGWTLLKLNGDKVKLFSVVLRYDC